MWRLQDGVIMLEMWLHVGNADGSSNNSLPWDRFGLPCRLQLLRYRFFLRRIPLLHTKIHIYCALFGSGVNTLLTEEKGCSLLLSSSVLRSGLAGLPSVAKKECQIHPPSLKALTRQRRERKKQRNNISDFNINRSWQHYDTIQQHQWLR